MTSFDRVTSSSYIPTAIAQFSNCDVISVDAIKINSFTIGN